MSPTSGSAATTRRAAPAELATSASGSAQSAAARAEPRMRRRAPAGARPGESSTVCEAMAVTPQEGGPLQREALVVARVALVDLIELEAQALELGRVPGREGRVGALPIDGAERRLGVVEARAERVAASEEALEVGVAAVAAEALGSEDGIARARVDADLDVLELLVVPVPLRAEHEALVELARPGLVAQRRVEAVEVARPLVGDGREGPAELEVQRVRQVEVGRRMHEPGELVEAAAPPGAYVGRKVVALADRVVDAGGDAEEVLRRRQPGDLAALGPALARDQALDRGRAVDEGELLHVPVRKAPHVGEEAPALERQVPRQRRGDERRLLDVEALFARTRKRGVAA